jgi:hypothetical protein
MILLEAILIRMLISADKPMTEVEWLTAYTIETDEFRDMDFGGIGLDQAYLLSSQWETDIYSILAASLIREAVSEKSRMTDLMRMRNQRICHIRNTDI